MVAHLDTYHMNIEETSFREPVIRAAEAGKLGYIHAGESHRGRLGTGTVNWVQFFAALKDVRYAGTVTFETFRRRSSTLACHLPLPSGGTYGKTVSVIPSHTGYLTCPCR